MTGGSLPRGPGISPSEHAARVDRAYASLPRLTTELDPRWRADVLCRSPDYPTALFFPGRGDVRAVQAAKAVCVRCPVTEACLDEALRLKEPGVRGGTTEKERRPIARERRLRGVA